MSGLQIITGMSYEDYIALHPDNIIPNAIYLLTNGMMFARGNKFGSDILIVDEFPVSPIPNIIYLNSFTMEQKMWSNGKWYTLQEEFSRLTNSQIDKMFQDDFLIERRS